MDHNTRIEDDEAVTADELEALGHEDISRGHARLALARRKRVTATIDELLDGPRVEARYHIKFRVVTDAASRGELVLEHAGRKPLIRVSEVERWMSTRRTKRKAPAVGPGDDAVSTYASVVAIASKRSA